MSFRPSLALALALAAALFSSAPALATDEALAGGIDDGYAEADPLDAVDPYLEVLFLDDYAFVAVTGTTSAGRLAIIGGTGAGGEYLTDGPCAGAYVLMDGPLELMGGRTVQADDNGNLAVVVGSAALDVSTLAVVDLESCQVSMPVDL